MYDATDVAVRIAEALGDDPDLYRAWVESADDKDLQARVDRRDSGPRSRRDAHPGTTVQFRLLRDGKVKHVLEMDAEQWREALGSYYDGTKKVAGEYTEEFQERWAGFVR